jgi:large subunit ribosomal protein L43
MVRVYTSFSVDIWDVEWYFFLSEIVNGRDKVIPLEKFEVNGIARKVQLLLDSSGAKIKSLKRRTVESTTEAARGIWSGMHVEEPFKI